MPLPVPNTLVASLKYEAAFRTRVEQQHSVPLQIEIAKSRSDCLQPAWAGRSRNEQCCHHLRRYLEAHRQLVTVEGGPTVLVSWARSPCV